MSAAPHYTLESDSRGGMLRLCGAISFVNAALAFGSPPRMPRPEANLDLDLAALDGADSATLAVLIAWSAQAHARGAKLRYLHAPQGLRNLARLCDVERLLGLV